MTRRSVARSVQNIAGMHWTRNPMDARRRMPEVLCAGPRSAPSNGGTPPESFQCRFRRERHLAGDGGMGLG